MTIKYSTLHSLLATFWTEILNHFDNSISAKSKVILKFLNVRHEFLQVEGTFPSFMLQIRLVVN